jgi:hypothetical protein
MRWLTSYDVVEKRPQRRIDEVQFCVMLSLGEDRGKNMGTNSNSLKKAMPLLKIETNLY